MDMQMPKMNGLEASKIILNQFHEGQPPIILALTANAMEEDRKKCMEVGMKDFLTKPIKIDEVRKSLKKWSDYIYSSPYYKQP